MFEDKDGREEQNTEGYQNENTQPEDTTYRMKFDHQEEQYGQQNEQQYQQQTEQQTEQQYQQQNEQEYQQQTEQQYQQTDEQQYRRQPTQQEYSYTPQGDQSDSGGPNKPNNRNNKRRHPFLAAIGCAVACGVIIGVCIIGSFAIGRNQFSSSANSNSVTVTTNEDKLESSAEPSVAAEAEQTAATGEYTVSQIAEQCGSSVVAITNLSVQDVITMFGYYQEELEGSGSGVIVGLTDDELLIATNYHVVEDADELTVCFFDSEDAVYSAQVKGTDPNNDLAVVAIPVSDISSEVLDAISIATIGDSDSLQVGDSVVAIGNALGLGQSVTSGIISAVDREVTIDNYTANLLQTDAAINPGNSGGALFNMKGELVGINSAKYASEEIEGMGFAIPTSIAQPIIETLMSQETRAKLDANYGWLNISGRDVTSDVSQAYDMPVGVYVSEAYEGGAAANAGIQSGDIITALDGIAVTDISTLRERLQYYAAGETVEVTVERNNGNGYEELSFEVQLDNASEQETVTEYSDSEGEEYYDEYGDDYYEYGDDYYGYDDFGDIFGGSGNGNYYSYGY